LCRLGSVWCKVPNSHAGMAGAVAVSKNEAEFTLQALRRENMRTDGRALAAYRRLGIRFGAAHGEVEVNFGPTRALAVCSGEVVTPPPERPNEGRITFNVEFGSIASPSFEVGRPSAQATSAGNFIERLLRGSHAIDQEALCIVGGQKVWSIRVDVRALDDDGNLNDVCAIAALCSLMHFRKADVDVRGEDAHIYSAEERCPVPLSIHHIPVPVSFALFASTAGKDAETAWILDPNRLEEAAMSGLLCIAVNQHGELCGLHKPGGMPVDFELIEHCMGIATAKAKEICTRIKNELEADLVKRQNARKNVHQRYTKDNLLSVDWTVPDTIEAPMPLPEVRGMHSSVIRAAVLSAKREKARARALEAQPKATTNGHMAAASPLPASPVDEDMAAPVAEDRVDAPQLSEVVPAAAESEPPLAAVDAPAAVTEAAAVELEEFTVDTVMQVEAGDADLDVADELMAVQAEAAELEAQLAAAQAGMMGEAAPAAASGSAAAAAAGVPRKKKKRKKPAA